MYLKKEGQAKSLPSSGPNKRERSFIYYDLLGSLKGVAEGDAEKIGLLQITRSDMDDLNQNLQRECTSEYATLLQQIEESILIGMQELVEIEDFFVVKNLMRFKLLAQSIDAFLKKSWSIYGHEKTSSTAASLFEQMNIILGKILFILNNENLTLEEQVSKLNDFMSSLHTLGVLKEFFQHYFPGRLKLNFDNFNIHDFNIDASVLIKDVIELKNYKGLDNMLLAPQYYLDLDRGQVNQFHSLFLQALQIEDGALEKLGDVNFSKNDLFDLEAFILKKSGYYYADTRSKSVMNKRGSEVYVRTIRKSKIDVLWANYEKIQAQVEAKMQVFERQALNQLTDEEGESLKIALKYMRKEMIKKAFLGFTMVYLVENAGKDSNFKRFALGLKQANLNLDQKKLQSLLSGYAEVYQGLDSQNLDKITDMVITELPFLLIGCGLGSLAIKMVARTIALARTAGTVVRNTKRVQGVANALGSKFVRSKEFLLRLGNSETLTRGSSALKFLTESLIGSGKLLLTLGIADVAKMSAKKIDERGEFDFKAFEQVVNEVYHQMQEGLEEGDTLTLALMLPFAVRLSSLLIKDSLMASGSKMLTQFEVKALMIERIHLRKFAFKLASAMNVSSQKMMTLSSGLIVSVPVYESAVAILNGFFEAGLGKKQVYTLLLNVTRSFKHCGLTSEGELKNLSILVAVLKMI